MALSRLAVTLGAVLWTVVPLVNRAAAQEGLEDAPAIATGKVQQRAVRPEAKSNKSKPGAKPSKADPNSPEYQSGDSKGSSTPQPDRDSLIETLKQEIAKLKMSGKKSDDDFFAVSTLELFEHQATVDYQIHQGEKETVERLADFMTAPPKEAIRKRWIIGRAKAKPAAEVMIKNAKAKSVEGQLQTLKLTKFGKRSPDDSFVVGTAEIVGDHADVRFQVLVGIKETANFILDFIFSGGEDAKREWHVFCRAGSEKEADKFVQQLRSDYDRLEAQRKAVADAYRVRSTRRC
jgi:hypothetical protein